MLCWFVSVVPYCVTCEEDHLMVHHAVLIAKECCKRKEQLHLVLQLIFHPSYSRGESSLCYAGCRGEIQLCCKSMVCAGVLEM